MARNRGSHGNIAVPNTSSGAVTQTGFMLHNIIQTATKVYAFDLNESVETAREDGLAGGGGVATEMGYGLSQAEIGFRALFPKASPAWGHRGYVTFSSGVVLHLDGFSLDLAWEVLQDTELSDPPPTAHSFMPGDLTGRGSITGGTSSSTAMAQAGANGAATLRVKDESSTDTTFAGTIIMDQRAPSVDKRGGLQVLTQGFVTDGTITGAGDNAIIDGAVGVPEDTEIVLTYNTGRTETVDVFLSSLRVQCQIGQQIQVDGRLKAKNAHTLA